jgi:hypothetical protein
MENVQKFNKYTSLLCNYFENHKTLGNIVLDVKRY